MRSSAHPSTLADGLALVLEARIETLRFLNDSRAESAIRIDSMRSLRFLAAATIVLTAIAARPLAAPARMTSAAASKITIDGNVDEWPQLEPLEETHVSAAAQNDGRNLYLLIATSDQARRRQLLAASRPPWSRLLCA